LSRNLAVIEFEVIGTLRQYCMTRRRSQADILHFEGNIGKYET